MTVGDEKMAFSEAGQPVQGSVHPIGHAFPRRRRRAGRGLQGGPRQVPAAGPQLFLSQIRPTAVVVSYHIPGPPKKTRTPVPRRPAVWYHAAVQSLVCESPV